MKRVAAPFVFVSLLALSACGDDNAPMPMAADTPPAKAIEPPPAETSAADRRAIEAPVATANALPSWAKVSPAQIAEAEKHGVPVALENELGMRFVLIPAGTFWMIELGPPTIEGPPPWTGSERSRHEATIAKPFYMQTTEVTNAQYRRFVPGHVCAEKDGFDLEGPDQPVCSVTWNEAAAFANWAKVRLPTEVQWERAARGGLVGKTYPWGDDWDPARVNSASDDDGHKQSAPVGSFPPNRYGLHDMTGNVGEWSRDPWVPPEDVGIDMGFTVRLRGDWTEMTPEEAARWDRWEAEEAKLPHRAVRGGSWMGPNVDCAQRFGLAESRRKICLGFRLLSPLPEKSK